MLLPIETPQSGIRIERVATAPAGEHGPGALADPAALSTEMSRLLAQLYNRPVQLRRERLDAIVASPANRLLVAREGDGILGTVTVVLMETLRGTHARIEDVVVDERARGRGLGAALTRAACALATREGAEHAELTSRPFRTAAQQLYRRLGFEQVETNVFRLHLG